MRKFILILLIAVTAGGCTRDEIISPEENPGGGSASTLADPQLSWSASTCEATIGSDANQFPTLANPNGVSVSFTSSNKTVATVDGEGSVTLLSAGTTSIIASSEATDKYSAGSASYVLTVSKQEGISWSTSTCTVSLDADDNVFPTLNNPGGQSISYSSSDTGVATIGSDGKVTLVSTGTTTITATSEKKGSYLAESVSYTLTVTSNADDGAGTWNFSSTGDSSSEDDIAGTTFTRMVTVTYSASGASVSGYSASADITVEVSGNGVTIENNGKENVIYHLTGTASNGFFKLYSTKKMALLLDGVSLTNPSGAAINIQSDKRCFVMVEGTNTLADGSSATYASADEDMKAVFFSEGQLVFSGSGSLKVTANNSVGKSCIASDDYVRIMDCPSITVSTGSSAGHCIRGKEYVQLSNGTTTITSAAAMKKGIASEDYVLVEGGVHTINVSGKVAWDSEDSEYKGTAGIKADNYFGMTGGTLTITNSGTGGKGIHAGSQEFEGDISASFISGGNLTITTTGSESNDVSCKGMKIGWVTKSGNRVTAYAGDLNISGGTVVVNAARSEGIEAKGNLVISGTAQVYVSSTGDDAINCQAELDVTGGYVYAYSSANDAMDANHDMKISGGYVFAVCTKGSPEVALDANTEERYKLYITGGTVVAYGGLESGYSSSNTVYSMSCTAGGWNALHNGSSYIAAFKAPSGVSSVAVCSAGLSKGYTGVSVGGATYCNGLWGTSSISGGTAVTLGTYSGGGGPGGGPGGGGPGGGGPGGGGWPW